MSNQQPVNLPAGEQGSKENQPFQGHGNHAQEKDSGKGPKEGKDGQL